MNEKSRKIEWIQCAVNLDQFIRRSLCEYRSEMGERVSTIAKVCCVRLQCSIRIQY